MRLTTPVETERREVAKQLLEDWRWCDRRIPATEALLHEALQAHGTSLTQIFGIGDLGAATILSIRRRRGPVPTRPGTSPPTTAPPRSKHRPGT